MPLYPIPHIPWGDLATWVTGFITLLLFIIGFRQIRNEQKERKKAENERATEAKRDQADHIAAWITKLGVITIRNQSRQPIYQLIVNGIELNADGSYPLVPFPEKRTFIAVVLPGDGYYRMPSEPEGVGRFDPRGIEIAFTDIMSRYWLRKSNGELLEINVSPQEYYKIIGTIVWESLTETKPMVAEWLIS